MGKKFIEGFLWGAGFTISASIVISIAIWLNISLEDRNAENRYKKPESVLLKNFEVLNSTHRLVESSGEYKGLVISGEIKYEPNEEYERLNLIATVRNSDGVFVDICSDNMASVKRDNIYLFKIQCRQINSAEQFETYTFELYGIKNENS